MFNSNVNSQIQNLCLRFCLKWSVNGFSFFSSFFFCRLVSEMTVEENILKKANQKRLLGDLAIEGGNFTTAFFKEVRLIEKTILIEKRLPIRVKAARLLIKSHNSSKLKYSNITITHTHT